MAERIVFFSTDRTEECYREDIVRFDYFSGFAISQKQKSIKSLHRNVLMHHPKVRLLEISTKSENPLGVRLSAFNLKYYDENTGNPYPIENIFQASKTYENGGPYVDLLNVSSKEAKVDSRHRTSGELKCFTFGEWTAPLEPKTAFYDWIYCKALFQNKEISERLLEEEYDAFTDIEFNHEKSINCQARACAIFVTLSKTGQIEKYLEDKDLWNTIYNKDTTFAKSEENTKQISIFDFD